jgi:hypothetical protein
MSVFISLICLETRFRAEKKVGQAHFSTRICETWKS